MKLFIELLAKQEHMVTTLDEKIFNTLIEKIVIHQKDKIEVHFKKRSGYRNIIWLFFMNGMNTAFYDIIKKIEQNV